MSKRNKFYEVKCQWNNLHWHSLAYFRKKEDAEEYINTKDSSYPIRIEEKEFKTLDKK